MALALYRKYRPATFAEVVGQDHVTVPLRTALAAGRINHAYLFSGPRGCGKTSSARILARSLNCVQGPTPDPCGICPSCIALAPEGPGSLDVIELDAASHGGVNDTRDLRDRAFYMPAESRYRVFIIDEAHMVSKEGFNALLKIVEEPPEHLIFIFATTEPEKVLTTIRSRTHHYPFRLIPPATLRALLERLCAEEGVTVESAVFPLVVQAGGGSARDSLSILDQLMAGAGDDGVTYRHAVALLGVTDAALLDEMADALAAGDGSSVFGVVDKVVEAGHDPRRFAADLLQRLRDLVILGAVPDAAAKGLIDAPEDQLALMAVQAQRLGTATVSRFAEVLHTGLVEMRGTTSPRLVLELMCARMLLPAASLTDAALLQRLERMERRMSIAGEDPGPGTGEQSRPVPPAPPAAHAPAPVSSRSQSPTVPPGQSDVASAASSAGPGAPKSAADGAARRPDSGPAESGDAAHRFRRPSQSGSSPSGSSPGGTTQGGSPPGGPSAGESSPPGEQGRSAASGTGAPAGVAAVERPGNRPPSRAAHTSPDLGLPAPPRLSSARPAALSPSSSALQQPAPNQAADREKTAPPAAPPAGPERPAGGVDVTDVRRVWTEVLAVVQRQRRTTQILLASATVASVGGGALHLTMPAAGMARRVVEPANADLLRAALKEVLGVDWVIRCDAAEGAAAPNQPGRHPGSVTGPRGSQPRGPVSDLIPPPEEEEIPDDYGDEPDPAIPRAPVRDPEEMAIELLTSQLGAKRLDP